MKEAPPRSTLADTEKNVPDNFGFGARQKNFLKRTGHFFGVLPSRSRAVGGTRFGLGKVKTIFWDWELIFLNKEKISNGI